MSAWVTSILLHFAPGMKTYIAGAGLIGLGIYEMSNGQYEAGSAHVAQGLGMIGLRAAVAGK